MMRTLYCTALFALTTVAQAAPSCPLAHWDDYGGTQLFRNAGQGAYVFATTHAQVDADGAPNAYHPDDVGLNCKTGTGFKGLDCPANGGYPNGDWWPSAIVPDPKNKKKGYVQPDGEFKGFFVSQTSLRTVPGRIWIRPSMSTPRRCLTWSFPGHSIRKRARERWATWAMR